MKGVLAGSRGPLFWVTVAARGLSSQREPHLGEGERVLVKEAQQRGRFPVEYLVHSLANCVGSHTVLDLRTGAFTNPLLGGGVVHESLSSPGKRFVAPNLTPDARWGWIASCRQGRLVDQRAHHPRNQAGAEVAFARGDLHVDRGRGDRARWG